MRQLLSLFFVLLTIITTAHSATIIDYNFDSQSFGVLSPDTWTIQATGGVGNTPAVRAVYVSGGTQNQMQLAVSAYSTDDFWVEFDTKIVGDLSGGMKFVKFFGSPGGDGSDNMTLIANYFGDHSQNQVLHYLDTLCEANLVGTYSSSSDNYCKVLHPQTWLTTSTGALLTGGEWHHYKAHVKRADTSTSYNGEVQIWYDGVLISSMVNMPSNSLNGTYFNTISFGDYSFAATPYNQWEFWIDNLYVGTTEKDAPPVNGTCGASNGQSLTAAPTTNLCATGTASSVSGTGPWSWTCAGSDGGSTENCSASVAAGGGNAATRCSGRFTRR